MTTLPFPPELVAAAGGPLVRLVLGPDGRPSGAHAAIAVPAPLPRVWAVLAEIERLPERVPMVHRVSVDRDQVALQLRFKVSLLSATFGFAARIIREEERLLELRWISGEPRGICLRNELVALSGAPTPLTILYHTVSFEMDSLGWLAKFFLRHHPEIRFGVFPGTALTMLDAIRAAATRG
ncbi:MAG: hypothetical protein HYY06_01765 [Deltaproteobacteria bacterium]|nr:hypothetical protein [Deltaproteobacteria bacterium]